MQSVCLIQCEYVRVVDAILMSIVVAATVAATTGRLTKATYSAKIFQYMHGVRRAESRYEWDRARNVWNGIQQFLSKSTIIYCEIHLWSLLSLLHTLQSNEQ